MSLMENKVCIEYYDGRYAKESKLSKQRRIPFYKTIGELINEKDNVLDIGCGNGLLAYFSKYKKYTGLDFSTVAIEQAKNLQLKNTDFKCVDFFLIDFNEIKYDTVIMTEVLEHIEDDIMLIKKVKKNKTIILSVPNNEPIMEDGKPRGYPIHQRAYSIKTLKKRYKQIKFEKIFVFQNWIIAKGIKI